MSGKQKYKLSLEEIAEIQADKKTGHSELARKYGVDHSTIWYHRKMAGVKLKIKPALKQIKKYKKLQTIECSLCGTEIKRKTIFVNNFCCDQHRHKFYRTQTIKIKPVKDYAYYEKLDKERKIKRDEKGNIIK